MTDPDRVPVTLTSLITTISTSEALETVLDVFKDIGFAVTSWQSGGIGRTCSEYLARMTSTWSSTVAEIAKGGFIRWATGGWLRARAYSAYNETPSPATHTEGVFVLASSDAATPYTIQPGMVWVQTSGGLRYRNTSSGSLPSGAGNTLKLAMIAETVGSQYNIPVGTPLTLVTAMPGVTVTNPPYQGGDWIVADGSDEQDDTSLRDQCVAKWVTLSVQSPEGVYEYWAKKASDAVKRVSVDSTNPDGPGTLRVYLAGSAGGISSPTVIATVDAVLQVKRTTTGQVTTLGTTEQVVVITGTVYFSGVTLSKVQSDVATAIAALFAAIPIGGVVIGTDPGAVFTDAIIGAVHGVPGVVRFNMTLPAADVVIGSTSVAVPNITGLVYSPVV